MKVRIPLIVLLSVPLAAQVSPSHFARAEGSSYDSRYLLGIRTPSRILQLHGDVPAGTIRSMSFRPDAGASSPLPASVLVVTIDMSNAAVPLKAPKAEFDKNHGTNKRRVSAFRVVRLPAIAPAPIPRDFEVNIPLQTPYQYDGKGPLCWDMLILSRTNTVAMPLDVARGAANNPAAQVQIFGVGCKAAGHPSPMYLSGNSLPNWSAKAMTLRWSGSSFPKNSLIALMLGNRVDKILGVPLPFEVPGSRSSPSGACTVYQNAPAQIPAFVDSIGKTAPLLGFPTSTALNGITLYAQAVAPQPGRNPWGLVMSNMVATNLVAPWQAVPVSSVGATNGTFAGTANANHGHVVRFN